jgi:hypothetical protein
VTSCILLLSRGGFFASGVYASDLLRRLWFETQVYNLERHATLLILKLCPVRLRKFYPQLNAALTRCPGNLEQEQVSNSGPHVREEHNTGPSTPSEPQSMNNDVDATSWFTRCSQEIQRTDRPSKDHRTECLIRALQLALIKLAPSPHPDLSNIFLPTFHPIPAVVAGMNHVDAHQSLTMLILDTRSMPLESREYVWGLRQGCDHLLNKGADGFGELHAEVFLGSSGELVTISGLLSNVGASTHLENIISIALRKISGGERQLGGYQLEHAICGCNFAWVVFNMQSTWTELIHSEREDKFIRKQIEHVNKVLEDFLDCYSWLNENLTARDS